MWAAIFALLAFFGLSEAKIVNPYDTASFSNLKPELLKAYDESLTRVESCSDKSYATLPGCKGEPLESYNLLRQVQGLAKAKTAKQIDQKWLKVMKYRVWKTTASEQQNDLLRSLQSSLSSLKLDSIEILRGYYENNALNHYNRLREFDGKPLVWKLEDIDHKWLNAIEYSIGYAAWLQSQKIKWADKTTVEQESELVQLVRWGLDSGGSFLENALFAYNMLAQTRGQRQASSFSRINKVWFAKIELEIGFANFIKQNDQNWKVRRIRHASEMKMDLAEQFLRGEHQAKQFKDGILFKAATNEMLFAYSYLAQLSGQPNALIHNVVQIDRAWFEETSLQAMQDMILHSLEVKNMSEREKDSALAAMALDGLVQHDNGKNTIPAEQLDRMNKGILVVYNLLAGRHGYPQAKALGGINFNWASSLLDQDSFERVHDLMQAEAEAPSATELKLFDHIKQYVGFKGDLKIVRGKGGYATFLGQEAPLFANISTFANKKNERSVIALDDNPDRDAQYFVAYHEMCHVVHCDAGVMAKARAENRVLDTETDPSLKETAARVEQYKALAKKYIGTSTRTGKLVHKALAGNTKLWLEPNDAEVYRQAHFARNTEARADLFAAENLLSQGEVNAIVNRLVDQLSSERIVAYGAQDEHPSDFERGLYTAGFLISAGYDINRLIYEYERYGVCTTL